MSTDIANLRELLAASLASTAKAERALCAGIADAVAVTLPPGSKERAVAEQIAADIRKLGEDE